jgi:hypothetical protein
MHLYVNNMADPDISVNNMADPDIYDYEFDADGLFRRKLYCI